jgi:hypothetical protein
MGNDFSPFTLIGLLQVALNNPVERSRLLQQPELLRSMMNCVDTRQWLFEQAYQTDDPARTDQAKNLIIAIMKSSRLLWHGGRISPDVYSEALSRTWAWFMEHLQTYNPEEASFVTWFNRKLGWMIQEVIREIADEKKKRLHPPLGEDDSEWIYPPAPDPDRWYETVQEWVELVQNNSRLFMNCRSQNSPHVNCQVLLTQILMMLKDSGEFSWDVIAQDYAVDPSALRKFCQRRCFPRFKQVLSD